MPRRRSLTARCRFAPGCVRSSAAGARNWRRWRLRCMRADCPRAISKRCFADERGQSLLSRTAVSEITQRLWAQYEAFASRDLSEFEVIYLFVDGIAERLLLGQPREAVLAAWGVLADGIRSFSTWRQGARHGELPRVLPGHATARLARSAAGHLRRRARPDPRDRGMLPALGAATLSRPQAAQSAEQGAGGSSRRWHVYRTTLKRALPICASHSRIGGRSAPPTCSSGCSVRSGGAPRSSHTLSASAPCSS